MSSNVATHLNIRLAEYDSRIRSFIPGYDELLTVVSGTLRSLAASDPTIVDLGIGTGALSLRCLEAVPHARIIGIDADSSMMAEARARLSGAEHISFLEGDFEKIVLPTCDAFVATLALHHLRDADRKRQFFFRCYTALRPGGMLVNGDCMPEKDASTAASQRETWLAHLGTSYSRQEAEGFLAAWSKEDTYFALEDEMEWMRGAGFEVKLLWRNGGFAVVRGVKSGA